VYAYQPGGLNEGYSDIIGTTMEFVLNDVYDVPDFELGENLVGGGSLAGYILRWMEAPAKDGKSIDDVCLYTNEVNVHYSSGVLNKAFTSSVRACENSGCGDVRDCVLLLGPLYMYANIHGLTQLSGYLDAASATCSLTGEFMERGTEFSGAKCTTTEVLEFVKDGWAAVGVTLDETCGAKTTRGCILPITPPMGIISCNFMARVVNAVRSTFGWVLGPILN
jgi:Thermolysin metallopeptidase, alpha-helical domain